MTWVCDRWALRLALTPPSVGITWSLVHAQRAPTQCFTFSPGMIGPVSGYKNTRIPSIPLSAALIDLFVVRMQATEDDVPTEDVTEIRDTPLVATFSPLGFQEIVPWDLSAWYLANPTHAVIWLRIWKDGSAARTSPFSCNWVSLLILIHLIGGGATFLRPRMEGAEEDVLARTTIHLFLLSVIRSLTTWSDPFIKLICFVNLARAPEDEDALEAEELSPVEPFAPTFTYPLFGEQEKIFGYKGIYIKVRCRTPITHSI